jgi:excisionase family DNA binding protein
MHNIEKYTISIDEAAKMSGLAKGTLYKRSASGELPILKIGSRVLIKKTDFLEYLDSHARKEASNQHSR